MITILGDFRQFSAKKLALFSKNQCNGHLFSQFSVVFSQKRQFFRRFFAKIFLKS
jgi:hypothetical protein